MKKLWPIGLAAKKIAALLSAQKIEDYKDFIAFLICLTFSINTDVGKIAGINNRIWYEWIFKRFNFSFKIFAALMLISIQCIVL